MKIELDISDNLQDEIRRLKENYYKIDDAIKATKHINELGSWLLFLQNEGINGTINTIEYDLSKYRNLIVDELRKRGGYLFTNKVLE